MADEVVDVIFKFGAAHLELFDFLVGSEIDFFFDAINGIVEAMIFIEHFAEMIVGAFEPSDDFTMFGELSEDGMMQVHGIHQFMVADSGETAERRRAAGQ